MKNYFIIILLFCFCSAQAQHADTATNQKFNTPASKFNISTGFNKIKATKNRLTSLILPTAAIAYGFISLGSDGLQTLDNNTKIEIKEHHPNPVTKLDNYL